MSKSALTAPKINTIISQNTVVKGDLSFSDGLYLEGKVIGNIVGNKENNATLTISREGKVKGNIKTTNLILDGMIMGDVHASGTVQLAAKARIIGSVYYKLLEMEVGAEVNGPLIHEQQSSEMLNTKKTDNALIKEPLIKIKT